VILDPDQERDAQRIAAETTGGALDASEMSTGKKAVAIRVAQLRQARQILVVAPLNTRRGWLRHSQVVLNTDTGEAGLGLPFHWIRNHPTGHEAMDMLAMGVEGVYFIGPQYATQIAWDVMMRDGEPIRNDKGKIIKRRNGVWDSIHPDMLVVDEVHQGTSNARSQRYKMLMGMRPEFTLGMSGTPHGNFFEGIYPVTHFIWPDHTPHSMPAFKAQYCVGEWQDWPAWNGTGEFKTFQSKPHREGRCNDPQHDHYHKITGEKNPGAYFASLPCVVRREFEHDIDIDSQEVVVQLDPVQRQAYDELERTMVTMIEGDPFIVEFPATLRIRLRQATLGMFRVLEDGSLDFDLDCISAKTRAILKTSSDPNGFDNEPALFFTDSKKFAKVLVHRLSALGPAEEWSGDVSMTKREKIMDRFQSGETKYVVMVVKSGGTGTDGLQFATRNVGFVSMDDSRIENEQGLARVIRRGQDEKVRVRYFIAENTYDQGILSNQTRAALAMNESMRLDLTEELVKGRM
jgi:hypothetical protein